MIEEPDYTRRLHEVQRIAEITKEIRWIIDHTYGTLNWSTYPPKDVESARKKLEIAWTLCEFCEYRNICFMETDGGVGILSDESNELLEKLISAIEKYLGYSDDHHTSKLDTLKKIRKMSDMAAALDKTLEENVSRGQAEVW